MQNHPYECLKEGVTVVTSYVWLDYSLDEDDIKACWKTAALLQQPSWIMLFDLVSLSEGQKIWNSFYLLSFCTLWPKNLVLHILIHHLPTKLARSSLSMFMAKSITYSKPKSMLCWLTFWYDCLKAYSSLEGYSLSFCHFLDGITDIFVDNLHRKERGKCGIRGTELKLRMSLPHCSTDAASQFFQPAPVTTTPAGRTNWLWKPK